MRALVTGASGFLGGRLTQLLVGDGAAVTILARAGADLSGLEGVPVKVVRGSLTEFRALQAAVKGQTHVFHCAATSTDWARGEAYFDSNVLGTGMLLEAASRESTLRRLVHVSTTDVYGYQRRTGDERSELVDVGLPYNRTKVQGETAVWAYADAGLPVTVIRPATIYGPRGKDFVVEIVKMLRRRMMLLVDGGRARGGFCYVDNVCCAMMTASNVEATRGQAYNLSDGTGVTWREYVSALASGLGLPEPWIDLPFGVAYEMARASELVQGALRLPGRPPLTRRAVNLLGRDQEFSTAKAARDFGYTPAVPFEEGMRRTVAWAKAQRLAELNGR